MQTAFTCGLGKSHVDMHNVCPHLRCFLHSTCNNEFTRIGSRAFSDRELSKRLSGDAHELHPSFELGSRLSCLLSSMLPMWTQRDWKSGADFVHIAISAQVPKIWSMHARVHCISQAQRAFRGISPEQVAKCCPCCFECLSLTVRSSLSQWHPPFKLLVAYRDGESVELHPCSIAMAERQPRSARDAQGAAFGIPFFMDWGMRACDCFQLDSSLA